MSKCEHVLMLLLQKKSKSVFIAAWVLLAQSSDLVFLFARESLTHPFLNRRYRENVFAPSWNEP